MRGESALRSVRTTQLTVLTTPITTQHLGTAVKSITKGRDVSAVLDFLAPPPTLQVTVISSKAVDAETLPLSSQRVMSPQLHACAGAQLALDACGDVWRTAYVGLLTNCVYATSAQVTSLLGYFMYRREKLVSCWHPYLAR